MIITTRKDVFYMIEITAQQAHNLQLFLEATDDGHVNELAVQAKHGSLAADEVYETLNDLREALRNR